MEQRKKQTYTNDGAKSTTGKYRLEQKAMPKQKNSVKQGIKETPSIWRTSTEEQKAIQNKVIRSADRGTVESDPTQGWGSKLNNDVLYNGLQSKKQADKFTKAYKNTLQRKKK